MKASEIIKKDCEKHGADPARTLIAIQELMKKGRVILLHKNNSVLALIRLDDSAYETHLFTEDTPLKLSQSMLKFFELIKNMAGINTIYGQADNPQIINLLKSLAKKEKTTIEQPDRSGYNWMISI
jgi:hypothetical protein